MYQSQLEISSLSCTTPTMPEYDQTQPPHTFQHYPRHWDDLLFPCFNLAWALPLISIFSFSIYSWRPRVGAEIARMKTSWTGLAVLGLWLEWVGYLGILFCPRASLGDGRTWYKVLWNGVPGVEGVNWNFSVFRWGTQLSGRFWF